MRYFSMPRILPLFLAVHLIALGGLAAVDAFGQTPAPPSGQTPAPPSGQTNHPSGQTNHPPDQTTGTSSQTASPTGQPTSPSGQPTNPILNSLAQNKAGPAALPGSTALPDFRATTDPRLPLAHPTDHDLALFGYSFFEPARQAIEYRRIYLRRLLFGAAAVSVAANAVRPTTGPGEGETLTDAQKVELFNRMQ